MTELNENQKKAVEFGGKHLLLLAGAGTGKTKTIIARAIDLISKGVPSNKILILTFTKRSAQEIVTRVESALGVSQSKSLSGSTFHSWCNHLLLAHPNVFGIKDFIIIDEDDQINIMKLICGKNSLHFENLRIKPQELVDMYSFARNTKLNLTETIKIKLLSDLKGEEAEKMLLQIKPSIEAILRGYEAKKRERNYLDYDDILQIVAKTLQKDENARKIICRKYEHILVDEMQDTNPLQWDLLSPFQEFCHLFCVGDDAQSIYSFRGADFKNIHNFKDNVKESEVYKLEDNYRSTQEILDLSNWLLEKSPLNYDKKLRAVRGAGIIPQLINVESDWEEAYFIADKILDNFHHKNKEFKSHLVLSRSQFYTRSLQAVFIEKKIPFITYGGRGFMESAHLKDLFAALRVVNNKNDEIAWIRFLTLWKGIGDVRASTYLEKMLGLSNMEECISWLQTLSGLSEQKLTKTLKSIFDNRHNLVQAVHQGYEELKEQLSVKYLEDWENKRKPDFPVLEVLASKYSNLGEFITECLLDNSVKINNSPTLQKATIEQSENKDKVIISTIHSAKGLEADTCFVLNVSPAQFPLTYSIGNLDEVEEERRILYVALTRAKDELIVTRTKKSIYAENYQLENQTVESYFLNELPENLVEQKTIGIRSWSVEATDNQQNNVVDFGMDFS
ncbi:ATP-dependent helicase [Emticicia sp. SJ17W-69]|uniref:ATP-dependent helicase n=1 Tax=Emticicia sp. SJ17W-69 TaxID=3421657 RepID=UPI003EBED1F7